MAFSSSRSRTGSIWGMSARSTSATSASRPSAASCASRRLCRACAALALAISRCLSAICFCCFGPFPLGVDQHDAHRKTDHGGNQEGRQARRQGPVFAAPAHQADGERIAIDRDRLVNQPAADVLGEVFGPAVTIAAVVLERLRTDGFERSGNGRFDFAHLAEVSRLDLPQDIRRRMTRKPGGRPVKISKRMAPRP